MYLKIGTPPKKHGISWVRPYGNAASTIAVGSWTPVKFRVLCSCPENSWEMEMATFSAFQFGVYPTAFTYNVRMFICVCM